MMSNVSFLLSLFSCEGGGLNNSLMLAGKVKE